MQGDLHGAHKNILELTEHTTIGDIPEEETVDFDVEAWDDVTEKALDPKVVRQARLKEMKYVKEKEVWQPISGDEARRRGWAVKASGEALGMLQLMSSVGVPMTASIMVDKSAALAVVARKGNGKMHHVRVGHIWVQQVASDGGVKYHKVNGEEKTSDACTKHFTGVRLRKLVARAGQCQRSGRAQESLRVQLARTAPADSHGCQKHQGEGECQHLSTAKRVSHQIVIR